jgi:hypothetical protein
MRNGIWSRAAAALLLSIIVPGVYRPAFAATAPPALTIAFTDHSVRVSNVAPGGQVYLYGLSRESKSGLVNVVTREQILADTDRDGVVEWTLTEKMPLRSLWAAVDVERGTYGAGVPPGYPATAVALTGKQLKKDLAGEVAQLAIAGTLVEVIVVRSADAIWGQTVGLRGPLDEGVQPGIVEISAANLLPRLGTTSSAPKHLKNGDVVMMFNSFRAVYAVGRVGEQK